MLPFTANPADAANATAIQTMRLRDDPPPITPPTRTSRKRKSPPQPAANPADTQQLSTQPPPPPPPPMHHALPPMMVHPIPGAPQLPPGYHYDFTPGGLTSQPPQPPADQQQQSPQSTTASGGRALSNSKRAEQNRKAQRAFRERRDQHVKALESRSQLLDAALASADEANRRWEECRTLVDQLRVENAALRAALAQQAQLLPQGALAQPPTPLQQPQTNGNSGLEHPGNGAPLEEPPQTEPIVGELKSDSADNSLEKKTE